MRSINASSQDRISNTDGTTTRNPILASALTIYRRISLKVRRRLSCTNSPSPKSRCSHSSSIVSHEEADSFHSSQQSSVQNSSLSLVDCWSPVDTRKSSAVTCTTQPSDTLSSDGYIYPQLSPPAILLPATVLPSLLEFEASTVCRRDFFTKLFCSSNSEQMLSLQRDRSLYMKTAHFLSISKASSVISDEKIEWWRASDPKLKAWLFAASHYFENASRSRQGENLLSLKEMISKERLDLEDLIDSNNCQLSLAKVNSAMKQGQQTIARRLALGKSIESDSDINSNTESSEERQERSYQCDRDFNVPTLRQENLSLRNGIQTLSSIHLHHKQMNSLENTISLFLREQGNKTLPYDRIRPSALKTAPNNQTLH